MYPYHERPTGIVASVAAGKFFFFRSSFFEEALV
jgi:hypothetical protein